MTDRFSIVEDNLGKVLASIQELPGIDVLVGVPDSTTTRADGDQGINNATLAYIHEHGSPARNIPARPALIPGVRRNKDHILKYFAAAGEAALSGDSMKMRRNLEAAGMSTVSEVRKVIQEGIPPPLADATLRARARRKKGSGHLINKGAVAELEARAAGEAPSTDNAKPLIDTGQLLKSYTYVLRG